MVWQGWGLPVRFTPSYDSYDFLHYFVLWATVSFERLLLFGPQWAEILLSFPFIDSRVRVTCQWTNPIPAKKHNKTQPINRT